MYESPITKFMRDIETQIREAEDGQLMYEVKQAIGFAVDKQELIKALEYDRDQYNKGYEDGLNADKWIPVSEPPKELGTYLIQTDGEPYMCQCRWTDVNPFWTDYKTKPHWNIFDLPQYSKVVAWMPLPKPYEPQESEE